jgi:chaperone required for assembly of F1-ATPase
MAEWAVKRFWTSATVEETDGGFRILLDKRSIKTPAKAQVIAPTRALADKIAQEWDAQGEMVDPMTMPYTRMTNSAIDKVTTQFDEVVEHLASYAETDHLCYRAEGPEDLVARQKAAWDPLLRWAAQNLHAPLNTANGIVYIDQPRESLSNLRDRIIILSPFGLAAVHDLITISGSFVAAMAVIDGHKTSNEIWELCRIDENWQIEKWGRDDLEEAASERKRDDFLHAAIYYSLLQ